MRTFEFVIACRTTPGTYNREDIFISLSEVLVSEVLENNGVEFDDDALANMIQIRHERTGSEFIDDEERETRHTLVGFALELPDEINTTAAAIQQFAKALTDIPSIVHVVKFEDPLLRDELAKRAEEIFALEMKLRRVLSLVYLHAKQTGDPYDLLRDDSVPLLGKEKPTETKMKAAVENQFFHLTFGNYVALNQRSELKLLALLETIRDADTYDKFRKEIDRAPIEHEEDKGLLAGLKDKMDPIERMRNCVAHNRYPSRNVTDNYENALPELDKVLNDYLSKWEFYEYEEMP